MKYSAAAAIAALALPISPLAAAPAGLGLTAAQLEEADVRDAGGRDVGEVEHVVLDANGRATALIVEIDRPDPQPDKLVRIGMEGLRATPDRDDAGEYDIMTTLTSARLLALPEWQAR